jgi:hypothetical protein
VPGAGTSETREIFDFLRADFARRNERLDRVDLRLDELTTCIRTPGRDLVSLSLRVAETKVDFAGMQGRLDTMDRADRTSAGTGRLAGIRLTTVPTGIRRAFASQRAATTSRKGGRWRSPDHSGYAATSSAEGPHSSTWAMANPLRIKRLR